MGWQCKPDVGPRQAKGELVREQPGEVKEDNEPLGMEELDVGVMIGDGKQASGDVVLAVRLGGDFGGLPLWLP